MNLTQGQKIMCGVVAVVAMLLVASIRMSCFSDGAGTITIRGRKPHGNEPGKIPVLPSKTRQSGRR